MIEPSVMAASLLTAACAMLLMRLLLPPRRRLASRIRPYTVDSRTALGAGADLRTISSSGAMSGVFGPIAKRLADWLGGVLDRMSEESLQLRLRQAGLYHQLSARDKVTAYRMDQLRSLLIWAGGAAAAALTLGLAQARAVVFVALGLVIGATRQRGKLEKAVERRRERMRIEVYTVDQLLAMRIRAGGGVVGAVAQMVRRGSGPVVAELTEALRLHRAGMRASDAFARISSLTPEPFCARTYSLLGIAEERGVDLAGGLLALAEDVREARREAIRRTATRRRAAMLIPTIVILAPVMLLFVGAPLPSLILGFQ